MSDLALFKIQPSTSTVSSFFISDKRSCFAAYSSAFSMYFTLSFFKRLSGKYEFGISYFLGLSFLLASESSSSSTSAFLVVLRGKVFLNVGFSFYASYAS